MGRGTGDINSLALFRTQHYPKHPGHYPKNQKQNIKTCLATTRNTSATTKFRADVVDEQSSDGAAVVRRRDGAVPATALDLANAATLALPTTPSTTVKERPKRLAGRVLTSETWISALRH